MNKETIELAKKEIEFLTKDKLTTPSIEALRKCVELAEDAFSSILSLITLPKDFCDVCWTSSWMTVPKDTPNAQQVIGKDEWVLCQMCEADRKIIKLIIHPELLPKINGKYQCEHVKRKITRSSCVWCNLTHAEKIVDRLKRELTTTKTLDEKEVAKVIFDTLNSPNIDVLLRHDEEIMHHIAKICSKVLCSHFSKPTDKVGKEIT